MRLGTLSPTKPAYYDRNAQNFGLTYQANGVAPHATTTRATWQAAVGKKGVLEFVQQYLRRATAAAPVGQARIQVFYSPGLAPNLQLPSVIMNDNTAGLERQLNVSAQVFAMANEQFWIQTADLSTGGTMDYESFISIKQFDGN